MIRRLCASVVGTVLMTAPLACGTPSLVPEHFDRDLYPRSGTPSTTAWNAEPTARMAKVAGEVGPGEAAFAAPDAPLTLDDCVRLMLANNPAITKADLDIAEAENQLNFAWHTWLPVLTLNGRTSYRSNSPTVEFMGSQFAVQERFDANATLRAKSDVIGFGRTFAGIKATQRAVDAVKAIKKATQQQLVAGVVRQFFTVLNLRRQIEVLDQSIATLQAQSAQARAFFDQGLVTENEALVAEVTMAERQQLRVELSTAMKLAISRLNLLMGVDPRRETALSDVPLETVQPAGVDAVIDLKTAVQLALEFRPDLLAARARVDATEGEASYYDWNRWPLISVFAEYSVSATENLVNKHWGVIGAEFNWTIFDNGAETNLRSAEYRHEKARAERIEAERAAIADVQAAYLKLRDARQRVAVTKQRLAQAEENLRILQARYNANPPGAVVPGAPPNLGGLVTSADVLEGEALRASAQSDLFRARYDELLAWAELELATGVRFSVHDWASAGREVPYPTTDSANETDSTE